MREGGTKMVVQESTHVEREQAEWEEANATLEVATKHVDLFLKSLRPLLIDHFIHGYNHGRLESPKSGG